MIIIQLMGGLGNQMFQYALGRRLAQERNTSLKLDLAWFQTQTERSFQLDTFRICAEIASFHDRELLTRANWSGLRGRIYRAFQRRLPYYFRRIVKERDPFLFDSNIIDKVSRNAYLIGYWQTEKYFHTIASLLHKELMLGEQFSAACQAWEGKIRAPHSISLHVRHGDYLNNNQFYEICSLEFYDKAINHMRRLFPGSTLFVFSDDMDWARQNLNNYVPIEFVEINNKNKDQEELLLMSMCHHHIIANSTYGWWGAWLGNELDKVVITPQKWFTDPNWHTTDLIPENWIKL